MRPRSPSKTRKLLTNNNKEGITTRTESLVSIHSSLRSILLDRDPRGFCRDDPRGKQRPKRPKRHGKVLWQASGHRHTDIADKDSGLSDKTNFPLLSSKWMRSSENSTNFSARRLLRTMAPSTDRRSLNWFNINSSPSETSQT